MAAEAVKRRKKNSMAAVNQRGAETQGQPARPAPGKIMSLTTDRQWRTAARLHYAAVCELHERRGLPWVGLSAYSRDERVAAFKSTVLGDPPEHGQPVERLLAHAILQAVRGGR
jgi:hypothetical protein